MRLPWEDGGGQTSARGPQALEDSPALHRRQCVERLNQSVSMQLNTHGGRPGCHCACPPSDQTIYMIVTRGVRAGSTTFDSRWRMDGPFASSHATLEHRRPRTLAPTTLPQQRPGAKRLRRRNGGDGDADNGHDNGRGFTPSRRRDRRRRRGGGGGRCRRRRRPSSSSSSSFCLTRPRRLRCPVDAGNPPSGG